jgi:hypothetical protein
VHTSPHYEHCMLNQAIRTSRLQNKVGMGTRSLWEVTRFRWFSVFWRFKRIQCFYLYLYLLQGSDQTFRRLNIKTPRFSKRRDTLTQPNSVTFHNRILNKLGISAAHRHSCTQPPVFKWHGALSVQLWVVNQPGFIDLHLLTHPPFRNTCKV